MVVELPDLYAQLNAHPLGAELTAVSTLASIKMVDTRRERSAHVEWLAGKLTHSEAIAMVARIKQRGVLP